MREDIIIALRSAFNRWRTVAAVKRNSGPFAVNRCCYMSIIWKSYTLLLGEEAEASPSIANTLWRV